MMLNVPSIRSLAIAVLVSVAYSVNLRWVILTMANSNECEFCKSTDNLKPTSFMGGIIMVCLSCLNKDKNGESLEVKK